MLALVWYVQNDDIKAGMISLVREQCSSFLLGFCLDTAKMDLPGAGKSTDSVKWEDVENWRNALVNRQNENDRKQGQVVIKLFFQLSFNLFSGEYYYSGAILRSFWDNFTFILGQFYVQFR